MVPLSVRLSPPTRLSVCPSVRPSTCHPNTSVRLSGRLLSTSLSGPSVPLSVRLSPLHVCPSVRQAVEYFAEWSLCLSVCHPNTSVRLSGRLLSTSLSGPSVPLSVHLSPQHVCPSVRQAVEYFAEWSLCPTNVVFLRVQTGVYDPLLIGDKAKWFSQSLQKIEFNVYDSTGSTLGAAIQVCLNESKISDENPTGD